MKSKLLFPLLSLVFLSAFPGWGLGGGKIEEFSAEQVHTNSKGKAEMTSLLYAAPGKMRMEMNAPEGSGKMITIVRQDTGTYWTIMPSKKAYMERKIDESEAQNLMQNFNKSQQEEDLGEETVNGFKCRKKRVISTQNIMGREMQTKVTIWKSDRLDWPIRTESDRGGATELRNIKEGKQSKELFEAPSGYRKAANMLDLFQ